MMINQVSSGQIRSDQGQIKVRSGQVESSQEGEGEPPEEGPISVGFPWPRNRFQSNLCNLGGGLAHPNVSKREQKEVEGNSGTT